MRTFFFTQVCRSCCRCMKKYFVYVFYISKQYFISSFTKEVVLIILSYIVAAQKIIRNNDPSLTCDKWAHAYIYVEFPCPTKRHFYSSPEPFHSRDVINMRHWTKWKLLKLMFMSIIHFPFGATFYSNFCIVIVIFVCAVEWILRTDCVLLSPPHSNMRWWRRKEDYGTEGRKKDKTYIFSKKKRRGNTKKHFEIVVSSLYAFHHHPMNASCVCLYSLFSGSLCMPLLTSS